MQILRWLVMATVMGVVAACASATATTTSSPLVPTDPPPAPSATPPIAVTEAVQPTPLPPTDILPTAAPLAKPTFIFLWEPG